MTVYRITSSKYSSDISGAGAAIKGGRWNKKGSRALYTSMHASLSCLEIVVHLIPHIRLPSFDLLHIEIPNESILRLDHNTLPKGWNTPQGVDDCAEVGQQWIEENRYLALQVPSSIIPLEYNVVLNPLHELYAEVIVSHVESFDFDQRLLK